MFEGQYKLKDGKRRDRMITSEDWNMCVFPGSIVTMSMIITQLQYKAGHCPRPSCGSNRIISCGSAQFITWYVWACSLQRSLLMVYHSSECGLQYVLTSANLANSVKILQSPVEDERTFICQIEQDLDEFGPRSHCLDRDEHNCLHFGSPKGQINYIEYSCMNTLSTIQGKHPVRPHTSLSLEEWITSSALPTVGIPVQENVRQQIERQEHEARDLESEEIELFHKIEIGTRDEGVERQDYPDSNNGDEFEIYCRNILDRYPKIPSYLAIRLAEANTSRARSPAISGVLQP